MTRSKAHLKAQREAKKIDGGVCHICGSSKNIQAHHLIPHSEGGDPHTDNFITLCDKCHKAYHGGKIEFDLDRF